MTRQEEIKKIALCYAHDELKDSHSAVEDVVATAFIDGVNYADSHPHWISVEDRKPKFKHKNDGLQYSEAVIVTDGEYRTSACWTHNMWAGWYGWFNGDEELKGITHWMPLPQAPKKGGKE